MATIATIATTNQYGLFGGSVDGNREKMLGVVDIICKQHVDLICLPEVLPSARLGKVPADIAEPVPGPTTDLCAQRAKQHECYIVCPLVTKRDGAYYNSAVILDRSGEVAGIYDKVHPVTHTHDYTVMEDGTTPGSKAKVFDLDFGRVAILICFDAEFPETWAELAGEGVQMVLFPSAYPGGFQLRMYAHLHAYYVVSATREPAAMIVNPVGEVVARTDRYTNFIVRDVNLDFLVAHSDYNKQIPALVAREYANRVNVRTYPDEGKIFFEPADPSVTIAQLCEQFGIESAEVFRSRHRRAYEALRAGKTPEPQQAAHGDRPQHGR